MLGTHFDLAKEVAAIASRKQLAAGSASPREAPSKDQTFGSPAELDYLLDQFAGRPASPRATGRSRS